MSARPTVTVLIPCLEEEGSIESCLEAVLGQDYPQTELEVIVIDGGSSDRTVHVAKERLASSSVARWEVVENPAGSTPSNLNAGLSASGGTYVCRVDARSIIPTDYVSTCLELLADPEKAVVGGRQVALPPRPGAVGDGIARALNNPWGMGFSRYRRGSVSGAADTVYLGFFRAAQLRVVGGWDPVFATNQDFELNRRLSSLGLVWFDDRLEVGYVPRPTLRTLFHQYRRFGCWKVRYWRQTGDRPRPRQVALLAIPAAGAMGLVALMPLVKRHPLSVLSAVVLGALALDSRTAGPRSGMLGRIAAVAALASTTTGWLSGVAAEAVNPRKAGAASPLSPDPR